MGFTKSPSGAGLYTTLTLAAQTTTGVISLPGGYDEARVVIRGTGGGNAGLPIIMQMNNDTTANNYIYLTNYSLFSAPGTYSGTGARGATATSAGGMIAILATTPTVLDAETTFGLRKANGRAVAKGKFVALAAADGNMIRGDTGFVYDQTSADISSFTVNFGAAFTGTAWVYLQ